MTKLVLSLILSCAAVLLLSAHVTSISAAEPSSNTLDWMKGDEESKPESKPSKISHEASVDYSFVAAAEVRQGDRVLGDTNVQTSSFIYVASIPVAKAWRLRTGMAWDRFSFGNPDNAPLPDTLQSTSLVLGADVELSDKWLMRFEFQPGIYSDFENVDSNDFNVPMIFGFSYIVDRNLQWVFGAQVNLFNAIPVMPGAGVRWQFADAWTLSLIFPQPRITYKINEQWQVYAGGELKGGSYRTGNDFGTNSGNPALNNALVNYTEIRAGAGFSYKIHPAVTVDLDGGWVVSRSYDYFRADTKMKSDGAPYAQVALKAKF